MSTHLDQLLLEQIERLRALMGPQEVEKEDDAPDVVNLLDLEDANMSNPPEQIFSAEDVQELEDKKNRLTSILSASQDQWSEFFSFYGISNASAGESGESERRITAIDISPISTAQIHVDEEHLPKHVVFDNSKELYLCTICDIKTASITNMERHVAGKEHVRRLTYLEPSLTEEVEEVLPEHVVWDNAIQYYKCTLCDAKGATMPIMERHLNGKEHTRRLSYITPVQNDPTVGEQLPEHVVWDADTQFYVCKLCDAKAATLYIMEGHLAGAKHLKKVEYEKELATAANEGLPPHIQFDEPSQFFICTLCDSKAATMYLMEGHIGGKEHQRRLGYGEVPSWGNSRTNSGDDDKSPDVNKPTSLPEHVIWDNIIQYYVCTLCDAKAATEYIMEGHLSGDKHKKKLANIEWYKGQETMVVSEGITAASGDEKSSGQLPAYCVYEEQSQMYVCKWCNKKSNCAELLQTHLAGKEHSKTCSNIGIPQFGQAGHFEASRQFVEKYGFDIWARQAHWPTDSILDAGMHWKCILCMKKFSTPAAVNEHLPCIEMYNQPSARAVPPPAKRIERYQERPEPLLIPLSEPMSMSNEVECRMCGVQLPSLDDLLFHEQKDPIHKELVRVAIGMLKKPGTATKPPQVVDPRLGVFEI